jgi:A/G-specific adenine glycosylase
MENAETVWYNVRRPDQRGFSAPVKRLLEQMADIMLTEESN